MRGIAFHWESPWRDIYSGLDPEASAWSALGASFNLELIAIQRNWPFPHEQGVVRVRSLDEAFEYINGAPTALAHVGDSREETTLSEVDWLVMGPSEGWRGMVFEENKLCWKYEPSPPGGYHALHLAHIAAHVGRS